jgi:hypothetical protein
MASAGVRKEPCRRAMNVCGRSSVVLRSFRTRPARSASVGPERCCEEENASSRSSAVSLRGSIATEPVAPARPTWCRRATHASRGSASSGSRLREIRISEFLESDFLAWEARAAAIKAAVREVRPAAASVLPVPSAPWKAASRRRRPTGSTTSCTPSYMRERLAISANSKVAVG